MTKQELHRQILNRRLKRLPKTVEHKRKISLSKMGVPLSAEHRQNIGEGLKRYWASETPA